MENPSNTEHMYNKIEQLAPGEHRVCMGKDISSVG